MAASFDKYRLYSDAVQDPAGEIRLLNAKFKKLRSKRPLSLREDFCGTGYLSYEWVKQSPRHSAVGIDHDPKVIEYGRQQYLASLSQHERQRMRYIRRDVVNSSGVSADITVAFNFSYWVFRKRKDLLRYFRAVRRSMKRGSIFFLDAKGGDDVVRLRTESKRCKGYTYYWECESFDPVSHDCRFSIHFKEDGKRMRKRVFRYHWRYWSLPEIRELLSDAGFSKTIVYWEGNTHQGRGNGIFRPVEKGENCLIWLAYIAALP